jgi:hypothetical protein
MSLTANKNQNYTKKETPQYKCQKTDFLGLKPHCCTLKFGI